MPSVSGLVRLYVYAIRSVDSMGRAVDKKAELDLLFNSKERISDDRSGQRKGFIRRFGILSLSSVS